MIVDNADDTAVFKSTVKDAVGNAAGQSIAPPSLESYLPQTQNGCIVFTSRNEDVASWLTGNFKNLIRVGMMNQKEGLILFKNKVSIHYTEESALNLLKALEYIPLAITQAAADINRLGPRGSVPRYLEQFHKSEKSRTSLLKRDAGDIRRDADAQHSVIITWQISFDQIRDKRHSAADLLSLMSFFDRQGIPDFALRCYSGSEDVELETATGAEQDSDQDIEFSHFEELRSYYYEYRRQYI